MYKNTFLLYILYLLINFLIDKYLYFYQNIFLSKIVNIYFSFQKLIIIDKRLNLSL